MRVEAKGETPSLTGELVGETHWVLERTQAHPPGNHHQKSPICLWVVEEAAESESRAKQEALFPLGPLPLRQSHKAATWVAPPWRYLRLCPLLVNRCAKTKIYGPNERIESSRKKKN